LRSQSQRATIPESTNVGEDVRRSFIALAAVVLTPQVSAAAPPLPASGPTTIEAGGTYSGRWISTDSTPAIHIATSEPVTIVNSVITNLSSGVLIGSDHSTPLDLTLARVTLNGGTGRVFDAENVSKVIVRNCTINNTSGMKISQSQPGSRIVITQNRHRNIQGPTQGAPVGNFIQLLSVQNTNPVEISWNEIINEHDKSEPEDIISIYKTAHVRLHHNYFQHQSKPGNAHNTSSQNGVTIEQGEGGPPEPFDNKIGFNQLVDGLGIAIFAGHDNYVHHNRVIQDGFLPGSKERIGNGFEALYMTPNGANNHTHHNVVGYVNRRGEKRLGRFPGHPEDVALNTTLRGRITAATERAEWKRWLAKLKARKIKVGA
jgi:hypothetical protein